MPLSKKAVAAVLVSMLLFSTVALFQFNLVSANPYAGTPVPPSLQTPNKDPPIVTIQSPGNNTYYALENEILLNFTVTQPDSWFKPNISCWINGVSYQLDGGQVVTLFEPTPAESVLPATKQFLVVFKGVSGGQHTLRVNVSAESQYFPGPRYFFFLREVYPLDVYQTINFTVVDLRIVGIATAIAAVVVGAGALFYFKKRNH
jgi:hypothetical protein